MVPRKVSEKDFLTAGVDISPLLPFAQLSRLGVGRLLTELYAATHLISVVLTITTTIQFPK